MNLLLNSLNGNLNYIKALNTKKNILVSGLTDSAKAFFALATCVSSNESGLIVTKSIQSAKKMAYDLEFFSSEHEVCFLPNVPINYYEVSTQSHEIENERIGIFRKIKDGKRVIVVTTVDAIVESVLEESLNIDSNTKIKVGTNTSIEELTELFLKLGYVRYDKVEGKGTFSIRGDIVDIFPVNMEMPCRIELDFETVDNIRTFDVLTQRSVDTLREISICQTDENVISKQKIQDVISKLNKDLQNVSQKLKESILEDIEKFERDDYKNIINKYFYLFQKNDYTLLDFFINMKFNIFFDEYDRLLEKSQNLVYENIEIINHLKNSEYIIEEYVNKYIPLEKIYDKNFRENKCFVLQKLDSTLINNIEKVCINTKEALFFRESFNTLEDDILKKKNEVIIISLLTEVRKNQVAGFLDSKNIAYKKIDNLEEIKTADTNIYIMRGFLSAGFESSELEFCLIAEASFNFSMKSRKRNKKEAKGYDILSYEDLNVGDLVVHENHGIGKYLGIESVNVQGVIKDYIKLQYAGSSTLYVPVTQLDLVKKYDTEDAEKVKLNTLNGKTWEKTKSKVKGYVKEVAKDLIKLYAVRERKNGFSFAKDTPWQKEFEDSFEYELTDDQKRAISEIKEDMESSQIMDRLLCGDVGYGKTEVALRVSFKAVMSGKQVAYLVPTTVLCLQQYKTFKDRMEKFGVKVEMLCRFKTKAEQTKILEELKQGKIDVIIGTHRLLSKDVIYKNLGFLVIDEEHRFGVAAKEEIKKLKENIDVLSMTATPIPRTLNMSLIGVRKMSNLTSPPIDRLPVHTYVLEYDELVIAEAIKKELLRDGQVYYLSNRVENIEEVAKKVKNLAGKEARVAVAHGRMQPSQVEDIMLDFINHDIDILVCTTILESGIDIPNANLIIVENADRLGLAQLYQIRGRVGRSNRLAYAYITYEKDKQISEISEKRLKAIKDFTEFGSGYKIALRDLELRGAGSLLGNLQHGHMVSVGYNMYLSLLEKALEEEKQQSEEKGIEKEKEEKIVEENQISSEVKIELGVSAYISDSYIQDTVQKIAMYQKISDIKTSEDALDIIDELIDRYGEPPREVENLIKIVEIRNICRELGITKICKVCENLFIEPGNLRYPLTNKFSNDILVNVQRVLSNLKNYLISNNVEKGEQ